MGPAMAEPCYVCIVRSECAQPGCCGSVSVRGILTGTQQVSGSTVAVSPGVVATGVVTHDVAAKLSKAGRSGTSGGQKRTECVAGRGARDAAWRGERRTGRDGSWDWMGCGRRRGVAGRMARAGRGRTWWHKRRAGRDKQRTVRGEWGRHTGRGGSLPSSTVVPVTPG